MLDTKLKNNPKIVWLAVLLVLCICSAGMILLYPSIRNSAQEDRNESSNELGLYVDEFTSLAEGNYVLYNQLSKETSQADVLEENAYNEFRLLERYTDYSITDEEGNILLESQQDVQEALESGQDGRYALKVEFVFDSHGQVSSVGVSGSRLDRETAYGMEQALISAQEDLEYDFDYNGFRKISSPENVTVRYGMTEENLTEYLYTGRMGDEESADVYWVLESDGFFWIFLLFVGITAAAAILLPFWKRTDGPALFRAPLEIVLLVAVIFFSTLFYQARMIWKTMNHELILIVSPAEAPVNTAVSYLLNFFVRAFSFGIVFWLVTCLRPMFVMGKEYWRQRVWTIRFILWVKRGGTRSVRGAKNTAGGVWQRFKDFLRRQYDLLLHFDFTDKTNKMILKVVIMNFVVLFIITFFWVFGIGVLIAYSIILFLFLRKYLDQVQEQYKSVLRTTSRLAAGDLDTEISEDAGIFNPVQDELRKIQEGFRRAVEEEMKSERMKTDLVTNVSHDLKTPLTAIITYVDLLKNEKDEEKRKEYIGILEKKSQRLKVLIEDLFEISKATSHNVTLHFMKLDIIGLLKQIELEYDRNLKAEGLEVKWDVPEEKVIVELDSEKAYRIFENLIVNISKYALPNTRVFIEVKEEQDNVSVRMKNVSAAELNFNADEITDRFVRGDVSRNTEGSGLGLSIAKSFTELMHGTLKISTEADLFRVEIVFPRVRE